MSKIPIRLAWAGCVALALSLCVSAQAAPTGHQIFLGPSFQGTPPASVPFAPSSIYANASTLQVAVYLHRADDAGPDQPPAMSFDLVWDPAVLGAVSGPGTVTASQLAQDWYDKQVTTNFSQAASGVLSVSVSGGVTFDPDTFDAFSTEITTFNNQLPVIAPEAGAAQQNPFPLLTVSFTVLGEPGEETPLAFQGAVLSDQEGFALPNQGALDTQVIITGDAFPPAPSGTPVASMAVIGALAGVLLALGARHGATARG